MNTFGEGEGWMADLAGPEAPKLEPSEPNVHLWSRDGFLGANAVALQPGYTPDYISVEGPHAPRRIELATLKTADQDDPDALPTVILTSRQGVKFSLSRRKAAMGFALKNVECDELHFIQSGRARFDSEFGSLDAGPAPIDRSRAPQRMIFFQIPSPCSFALPREGIDEALPIAPEVACVKP